MMFLGSARLTTTAVRELATRVARILDVCHIISSSQRLGRSHGPFDTIRATLRGCLPICDTAHVISDIQYFIFKISLD